MAILRKTTQALTESYGAAITIESGWENVSVTLNSGETGYWVEVDGANEEAVPAGSSWVMTTPGSSTQGDMSIKIKVEDDGDSPTASVIWFK